MEEAFQAQEQMVQRPCGRNVLGVFVGSKEACVAGGE